MHKIRFFLITNFIVIFTLAINCCFAGELDYLDNAFDSESLFGIEEPEDFKNNKSNIPSTKNDANDLKSSNSELELSLREFDPRVKKPVGGWGELHVVIESVDAFNHSLISKKADRVEVWLGHLLLSRLEMGDVKVSDQKNFRIFDFPNIVLKTGYYFISIRMYSNGVVWKNRKFHEKIYQVGIHEGQCTNLHKKVPFLNW